MGKALSEERDEDEDEKGDGDEAFRPFDRILGSGDFKHNLP